MSTRIQSRLTLRPIGLRAANLFVGQEHRHHPPTRGHKFSVSVVDANGTMHGVAIAGRPVARLLDDGLHLEALRVCTDGTPNACSALYGAIARAGIGMGYERHNILTYILDTEPGTSLKAAGWVPDGETQGGEWHRALRPRAAAAEPGRKVRWIAGPRPPAVPEPGR